MYLNQMFIPADFAHGYCVMSKSAIFSYKFAYFYNPADELPRFKGL